MDLATQISGTLQLVMPEVFLTLAACVMFLLGLRYPGKYFWQRVSILLLVIATVLLNRSLPYFSSPSTLFHADSFNLFMRYLGLGVGMILVMLSWDKVHDEHAAEYFASLLIIISGVNLVSVANDLISLFLALEMVSIPTYLLLYFSGRKQSTSEATMKYFLLSIFSSAVLLFGMSYLYGCSGTTNLEAIRSAVRNAGVTGTPALFTIALIMIVAGLSFRLTAAPFHFYAPDVYQGAALLPVTLLSSVPKLAGISALYQLIILPFFFESPGGTNALLSQAYDLFWIIALVSILIGNVMGLLQNNLRRLIAYSGVAHAGYLLVGIGAAAVIPQPGTGEVSGLVSALFYLVVYLVMTLGFFAVLNCLDRPTRPIESIDDLAGLGADHPLLAILLMACLFSLTGLPLTVGFWGKLQLFLAGWNTELRHYRILGVVMAIGAAIGAWYYLRIVAVLWFRTAVKPIRVAIPLLSLIVASSCALLLVAGFFIPNSLQNRCIEAMAKVIGK